MFKTIAPSTKGYHIQIRVGYWYECTYFQNCFKAGRKKTGCQFMIMKAMPYMCILLFVRKLPELNVYLPIKVNLDIKAKGFLVTLINK